jgi:hypothetical protein
MSAMPCPRLFGADASTAGRSREVLFPQRSPYSAAMQIVITVLPWLIGAAVIAVVGVLFAGLVTMTRGGEENRRRSNILMRWRVGTQATAVVLIVIYFLLTRT